MVTMLKKEHGLFLLLLGSVGYSVDRVTPTPDGRGDFLHPFCQLKRQSLAEVHTETCFPAT